MSSSESEAKEKNRSTDMRTLSLAPTLLALAIGVAGTRYWYVRATASRSLYEFGLKAIEANQVGLIAGAAEGLSGLPGNEAKVHLLWGAVLLRSDRPIEAIVQLGYAKDAPETAARAHTLSGEAFYRTHQFRDALKILHKAVELDPAQTDAHRWLAATYFDLGAMNDAIRHLETVALQVPGDPRPHRLMGLIYRDFEEYSKATRAYRESLERKADQPDWRNVRLELAECLIKQRLYRQAQHAIAPCPESAQKLWLQAEIQRGLGQTTKALETARKALTAQPDHMEALYLEATLELEADDVAAAVATAQKTVDLYPYEWRPRYTLAMALRRQGDEERAAEHLARVEELRKLREDFTKLHAQAVREPENAELRYRLGVAAEALGKLDIAANWYQVALAMDPQYDAAQAALARLAAPNTSAPRPSSGTGQSDGPKPDAGS